MSVLTGVDSSRQLKQNVELFNKSSLPGDLLDKVRKNRPDIPGKHYQTSLLAQINKNSL